MRKFCLILDICSLCLVLTACGSSNVTSNNEDTDTSEPTRVEKTSSTSNDVYTKSFKIHIKIDGDPGADDAKLTQRADEWLDQQDLSKYTPHITRNIFDGHAYGAPSDFIEHITMVPNK